MSAPISPSITAIVPARNEEQAVEISVRSLAAQPEVTEIRVVNDGSTDRTGEILTRLAAEIPKLRVIDAAPLPPGWVGKNHAAWLGAQNTSTDWLLFTDADVRHLPGSANAALRLGHQCGVAVVSFSPRQVLETWWERSLIPLVFSRLDAHFSYARVNDPLTPDAAANGQYLLIRRDAYESMGGHSAVAHEVLEDVALARRAKAAGLALCFVPGKQVAETRMYHCFAAMWEGWTKNLYPLAGGTPLAAAAELLRVLPITETAFLALGFFYPLAWFLAAAALLRSLTSYALQLRRHPFPLSYILWWGPGVVLYSAALMVSAGRYSSGTVAWKGRTYPVRP